MQAGELSKDSHVMLKGKPCKVAEVTTSKTGKHGHAKAHIVGLDIFTSKKLEDLCPSSHNMEVPFVKRMEFILSLLDEQDGSVSLLDLATSQMKCDLRLPASSQLGEPTEDDLKVQNDMIEGYNAGKSVQVFVISACSMEKIVAVRVTDD